MVIEALLLQVGNNEEKIASGIKLLSITTSLVARRSLLGDLIKVTNASIIG